MTFVHWEPEAEVGDIEKWTLRECSHRSFSFSSVQFLWMVWMLFSELGCGVSKHMKAIQPNLQWTRYEPDMNQIYQHLWCIIWISHWNLSLQIKNESHILQCTCSRQMKLQFHHWASYSLDEQVKAEKERIQDSSICHGHTWTNINLFFISSPLRLNYIKYWS